MKTKTKKRKSLARIKKLSTLLALGLNDLRKQERAKNSVVQMSKWLCRDGDECVACVAGSVMRWSLGAKPHPRRINISPWDFAPTTTQRLIWIDYLRAGLVSAAASRAGIASTIQDRDVPEYDHDRDGWWDAMFQLLGELKAAGE